MYERASALQATRVSSLSADSKCKSPGLLHNRYLTSVQICRSVRSRERLLRCLCPANPHGSRTHVPCRRRITSSRQLHQVRSSCGSLCLLRGRIGWRVACAGGHGELWSRLGSEFSRGVRARVACSCLSRRCPCPP